MISRASSSSLHVPKTPSADTGVGPAEATGEVHSLHRVRERAVPATDPANHGPSGSPPPDTIAVITMRTDPIVNACPIRILAPVLIDPPTCLIHVSSSTSRFTVPRLLYVAYATNSFPWRRRTRFRIPCVRGPRLRRRRR